jgi:hypothetical protein
VRGALIRQRRVCRAGRRSTGHGDRPSAAAAQAPCAGSPGVGRREPHQRLGGTGRESIKNRGRWEAAQATAAKGAAWTSLAGMAGHQVEQVAQSAVEGSGLQEPMSAFLRPLHRLFLRQAFRDHDIDSRLDEGGRNDLAMVPALRVVRDRAGIVLDVGDQPRRWLCREKLSRRHACMIGKSADRTATQQHFWSRERRPRSRGRRVVLGFFIPGSRSGVR